LKKEERFLPYLLFLTAKRKSWGLAPVMDSYTKVAKSCKITNYGVAEK
jgi:hypothetical protein